MQGNRVKTACIFGGALFAAGVVNAQEFVVKDIGVTGDDSLALSYVLGGSYDVSFAFGGVLNDTSSSTPADSDYGSQYAQTTVTSNLARLDAGWLGGGSSSERFASGYIQLWFSVAEDTELEFSWDLLNTDGSASIRLLDDMDPGGLVSYETYPASAGRLQGSDVIALEAGLDYGIQLVWFDLNTSDTMSFLSEGDSFIQARLIPAPSGVGILGLGCLAVARRRRK